MGQMLIEKLTRQVEEQEFELSQANESVMAAHTSYQGVVRELEEVRKACICKDS
jgi:hypothetical protein